MQGFFRTLNALRFVLCALSMWVLLCGSAQAVETKSNEKVSLNWVRATDASQCVTARLLANAVESRLGKPVFVSSAEANIAVEASIEQVRNIHIDEVRYRAMIRLIDKDGAVRGERTLVSKTSNCRDMDQELSLIMALMIDPQAVQKTDDARAVQPLPPKPPAAQQPPSASSVDASPRDDVTPNTWMARVGPVLAIGFQPSPGVGGRVGIGVKPKSFVPVWLDGFFVMDASSNSSASGRLTVRPWWVQLSLCPLSIKNGNMQFQILAGGWTGRIIAQGEGFSLQSNASSSWTGGVLAGAHVDWLFSRHVSLFVEGTGYVPFVGLAWYSQTGTTQTELFHTSPVTGSFSAGATFGF